MTRVSIYILILLLFCGNTILSYDEFRLVRGSVEVNGEPLPGQNIIILGTINGTITGVDGNFCITAPVDHSIVISAPQCFGNVMREIIPSTEFLKISLNSNRKNRALTKKALKKWEASNNLMKSEVQKIYLNVDYHKISNEMCR